NVRNTVGQRMQECRSADALELTAARQILSNISKLERFARGGATPHDVEDQPMLSHEKLARLQAERGNPTIDADRIDHSNEQRADNVALRLPVKAAITSAQRLDGSEFVRNRHAVASPAPQ
ncbi:MAG TPA: hypothetical protein VKU62_08070, partial [Thermoanaerobaculia bacterium]|nr:hypothetical protein [Thermoanaerobaculia bacterium]